MNPQIIDNLSKKVLAINQLPNAHEKSHAPQKNACASFIFSFFSFHPHGPEKVPSFKIFLTFKQTNRQRDSLKGALPRFSHYKANPKF